MQKYDKRCKVCNSAFKSRIESLALQGMNPQQIYEYLQSIQDPNEKLIVQRENIAPSSIRRHLDNHFDRSEIGRIHDAEVDDKLKKSRKSLQDGTLIVIDKINSLSHLIDASLIKMEKLDSDSTIKNKDKYTISVQYANSIKGLIESLSKLTDGIQNDSIIDVNFFTTEISEFADIVIASIREVDKQLNLNGELEYLFGEEFQKRYTTYRKTQVAIMNGEAPKRKPNLACEFNDGM